MAYDLKNLTLKGEGSHLRRMQRHRGLQAIARDLRGLGYALPGAASLKPKQWGGHASDDVVDGLRRLASTTVSIDSMKKTRYRGGSFT